MERPLVLVGGGGHCKSVIEAAESAGHVIKGILDLPHTVGTLILGHKVIGTDDDISKYVDDCDFVVTVGSIKNPSLRMKLHDLVVASGGRLATVVASSAHVSEHASIGEGTVVLHQANINADARIGKSVIVNSCADIEHDVVIGDFCHVSTGAMVNGGCRMGDACFIGSRSVIANCVEIISNTVVGAGTVVIRNIDEAGVYVGNPATKKK